MKRLLPMRSKRGYTLLELTLSIAFFTVIITIALVGFIGIFGIYNKAQSLTRTQEEARKAMDQLTRDLRQTKRLQDPGLPSGVDYGGRTVLARHCLDTGGQNVAYGLVFITSRNHYVLARSTECRNFANAELVTSSDVWSEKDPPWPDTNGDDGTAPDTAPFKIVPVATTGGVGPIVWQARIGVFRGQTAPSKNAAAAISDQFGAGTMLQSIIISRSR
ncbi:hypothetical protein IPM44_00610 [bacterium]|nr:MAG: hypothetical protein IPM44_00610 [bacterium]